MLPIGPLTGLAPVQEPGSAKSAGVRREAEEDWGTLVEG